MIFIYVVTTVVVVAVVDLGLIVLTMHSKVLVFILVVSLCLVPMIIVLMS